MVLIKELLNHEIFGDCFTLIRELKHWQLLFSISAYSKHGGWFVFDIATKFYDRRFLFNYIKFLWSNKTIKEGKKKIWQDIFPIPEEFIIYMVQVLPNNIIQTKNVYVIVLSSIDGEEVHTLSKRRCNTVNFPAPVTSESPILPLWNSVPEAWSLPGGWRRRWTIVSPNFLIWGTKTKAWKLTLHRRCWIFVGKLSKAKRWENGAIAAMP